MGSLDYTTIVRQNTTARYTAQLVDEVGTIIPGSSLSTFTLTLYDYLTGRIINNRISQNILNSNGVTVDESGSVVWTIAPADNVIVTATQAQELHVAKFRWTYGANGGERNIGLNVTNLGTPFV